jgi:hypothetical protein
MYEMSDRNIYRGGVGDTGVPFGDAVVGFWHAAFLPCQGYDYHVLPHNAVQGR